jgi:hypothetical protein
VAWALGLGFVITLFQVLLACTLSGQPAFRTAYKALFHWDSGFFASFVERGYYSPPKLTFQDHGNVSFLPAYPLAASLVHAVTGWTTPVSLLVTAQLAAWGFWTYLLLLFRRWGVSGGLAALGALLIASHPAAFYLVAGYTESLFLFSLLGFLYWCDEGSNRGLALAAVHGFVMTATRVVGVPVAFYPVLRRWLCPPDSLPPGLRPRLRHYLPTLAVAGFAVLGTALFFLYCHCCFGHWDLYTQTRLVGWRASSDALAFFKWRTYVPRPPLLRDGFLNPVCFNQFLVPLTVLVFATLLTVDYRQRRSSASGGWEERVGWYACAALLLYISVCGDAPTALFSMVRYLLPVEVPLALAVIHRISQLPAAQRRPWCLLGGGWVGISGLFQLWLTYRFTHALYVA